MRAPTCAKIPLGASRFFNPLNFYVMARENLKLVSCRIDPDALKAIDQFVAKHRYWKRNSVINQIVTNVFALMSEKDIYDLVRHFAQKNECVTLNWESGEKEQ